MQENDDSTRGTTPNQSTTMLPPMSAREPTAGRPSAEIRKSSTRVPEWTGKTSQRSSAEHDVTPAATEQRRRPRSPRSTPSQREQPMTESQINLSPALNTAAPGNVGGEEQGTLSGNASATASRSTSEDSFDSHTPGVARRVGGRHSRPMANNNILLEADRSNAHEQDDRRCGDHPGPQTTQPPSAFDAKHEPTAATPTLPHRQLAVTSPDNLGDFSKVDGRKIPQQGVREIPHHLGQAPIGHQREHSDATIARFLVEIAEGMDDNDTTEERRAVDNNDSAPPHDNNIVNQHQVEIDLHRRNMMGSKSIDMNTCAKHTTKSGTR